MNYENITSSNLSQTKLLGYATNCINLVCFEFLLYMSELGNNILNLTLELE